MRDAVNNSAINILGTVPYQSNASGWINNTQNTTTTLKVGIGTNAPNFSLEVVGNMSVTAGPAALTTSTVSLTSTGMGPALDLIYSNTASAFVIWDATKTNKKGEYSTALPGWISTVSHTNANIYPKLATDRYGNSTNSTGRQLAGQILGGVQFKGMQGSFTEAAAELTAYAITDFNSTNTPGKLAFRTVTQNTTTLASRGEITDTYANFTVPLYESGVRVLTTVPSVNVTTQFGGNVTGTYDAIVLKNGTVGWNNISSIPAGFADGTDNAGTECSSSSCSLNSATTSNGNTILTSATSWGGDLSGTGASPQISDNSHNHDATNITAGTLSSARISGAYTGITNVGTLAGVAVSSNINLSANLNITNGKIYMPNGAGGNGTVYDNSTCTIIYSPNGASRLEVCN
jgi:hypothetical protein